MTGPWEPSAANAFATGKQPRLTFSLFGCETDDKIIAVHLHDPDYAHYSSVFELPPHRMREVKRFFEDYKALKNKLVVIEDFLDSAEALESITQAIASYRQHRHVLVKANRKERA